MEKNVESQEILKILKKFFAESYKGRKEVPLAEIIKDLQNVLPPMYKEKVDEKRVETILIRGKGMGESKFIRFVAKKTQGEELFIVKGDYDRKTKMYYPDSKGIMSELQSNAILGMIKVNNELNIDEAAGILNITKKEVKELIQNLLTVKKIDGEIRGNHFTIKSDVNEFINALNLSFQEWHQTNR